jgi:hypothetical protein
MRPTWEEILKLATRVDASYAQHTAYPSDGDCVQLARLVLEFQTDVLQRQKEHEPLKK